MIDYLSTGEESLTIFLDKQKLNKKSEGNSNSSVVSLELLHQLAASYFTDRESTLRRLHHLQIATSAIKVPCTCTRRVTQPAYSTYPPACALLSGSAGKCLSQSIAGMQMRCLFAICRVEFVVLQLHKQPPIKVDMQTLALL